MAEDAHQPDSQTAVITPTIDPVPDAGTPFSEIVPDGFKDKPWVSEVKNTDQFFKMFDDQKAALSRRPAGIPQDNATPEERATFNKAFGVPEDAKDYDFAIDGVEFTDADNTLHEALRPVLKEAGINKQQLAVLAPGFNKIMQEMGAEAGKSAEQQDAEFNELVTQTFGDRKDAVLANGAKLMELAPPEFKDHIKALDNKSLIALAAVLDGVRKEHISEDSLPASGGASPAQTQADSIQEGTRLMGTKAYTDFQHPEHEATVNKVNQLFGTAS